MESGNGTTVEQPHEEHKPAPHHEQKQHQQTETDAQQQHHQPADDSSRKKVLIGIDRSKYSDHALRWYAKKLHSPGDQVVFLNVAEPPELALGFGMAGAAVADIYTKAMEETIESAKRLASSVKETCRSLGIDKFRFLERIGHGPGQSIVEVAEEEQVDLIVVGSRGVGLLRRTFLGSVSDYVLHHARRAAVAIVPDGADCCAPNSCDGERTTAAAAPSHPVTKQE